MAQLKSSHISNWESLEESYLWNHNFSKLWFYKVLPHGFHLFHIYTWKKRNKKILFISFSHHNSALLCVFLPQKGEIGVLCTIPDKVLELFMTSMLKILYRKQTSYLSLCNYLIVHISTYVIKLNVLAFSMVVSLTGLMWTIKLSVTFIPQGQCPHSAALSVETIVKNIYIHQLLLHYQTDQISSTNTVTYWLQKCICTTDRFTVVFPSPLLHNKFKRIET